MQSTRRSRAGRCCPLLVLVVVLVALAWRTGPAQAATFSSAASGLYNATATWGGASEPSNGGTAAADSVTINGHTVTITTAGWAALDTIQFANNAANLTLQNDTNTTFSLATLDLTGSNQTITVDRATNGGSTSVSTVQTLDESTLTLGGGRTLTVAKGSHITTANALYGLTLNGAASLSGTQTFTVNNNGTGAVTLTIAGSITESGTGTITKTGTGVLVLQGNNAYTGGTNFNGGIVQAASANALGTTGTLSFGGGTLQYTAASAGNDYSTRFSTAASQTFSIDTGGQTITFNNALTSSGGNFQLLGTAGSLTLTQAAGWTGTTSVGGVAANTLVISNPNQISSGKIIFNGVSGAGQVLKVTGGGTLANAIDFQPGSSGATVDGVGSAVTLTGTFTNKVNGKVFTSSSSSGTGSMNLAGNVYLSESGSTSRNLIFAGTTTSTLTVSGVISDYDPANPGTGAATGSLSASSSGNAAVVFTGNNTYRGTTGITFGSLSVSSLNYITSGTWAHHTEYSSLGVPASGNGTITLGGANSGAATGVLIYTSAGQGETTDRGFSLAGTTGGGTIQADGSGALVFTGTFAAAGAGTKTFTLTGSNTGSNEFQAAIVDNLTGTNLTNLAKSSNGTWVLSGGNTYTGTTVLTGGKLEGRQNSGTPFGTGALTVGASILSLAPAGSGSNVSLTGASLATGTGVTYNADAMISLNKGSQTSLTYTVGGATGVATRGTNGTLIVSASTIAGLGSATGERLKFGNASALSANTDSGIVRGAVAQDRGNNNAGDFVAYDSTNGVVKATYTSTDTFANTNTDVVEITTGMTAGTAAFALKVGAVTLDNTSNTLTLGRTGVAAAALILNGGTISGGTLATAASAELVVYVSSSGGTISSSITTATNESIIGPGVLDLSGSTGNNFTGGLRINNSTVNVTDDAQLGAATSQVTLTGGTLRTSGTVSLGTTGQRTINLALGQDKSGGTFDVTSGTTTFTSNSTGSKRITGAGTLTKSGNGTLVLNGSFANDYTGATVVSTGTMLVNGSIATSSGVSVANGATLGGSGTVSTVDASAGGTVSPGTAGAAILSATGNFNLGAGHLALDIAKSGGTPAVGSDYDQVSAAKSVNLTGGDLVLTVSNAGLQAGDLFYVLSNGSSSAITGTLTKLNGSTTALSEGSSFNAGGVDFQITYLANWTGTAGTSSFTGGNDLALQVTGVPEPSTLGLLSLGAVALLRRRRR